MDPLVGDGAELRERENLEAAAVGQDRLVPVHELVETTRGTDDLATRAEIQVVGIAEQDLGAGIGDLLRGEPLDRGLRAHRHEDRRANLPVGGLQDAEASGRRRIGLEQGEHAGKLGGRLARWQGKEVGWHAGKGASGQGRSVCLGPTNQPINGSTLPSVGLTVLGRPPAWGLASVRAA